MVEVGALLAALLLAWLPWRGRLGRGLARLAFAARSIAILGLILLLIDPGIRRKPGREKPLILLDNSISTHSQSARIDSARRAAYGRGEVISFGEAAPGVPGGSSRLREALVAATAAGRPVEVITDGELADLASIPADLLSQATVTVIPRESAPDIALTAVRMPNAIAVGDTLGIEVELDVSPGWTADSTAVELRLGDRVLLHNVAAVPQQGGLQIVRFEGVLPADLSGELWLTLARVGEPDAEPEDDVRWRRLWLTPTPGIVVISSLPDWDARTLYRTLADVSDGAVRGYVQLAPGRWFRSNDLKPVSSDEVSRAAGSADLLAVRGDTTPWRKSAASRILWPEATVVGDWYPASGGVSPVSEVFGYIATDSLPPLKAASDLGTAAWTGLTVRLARRGEAIPVMVGRTEGGRSVVFGADGFHEWAFRGGESEQAWRSLLAGALAWLLQAPVENGANIQPLTPVTERGRAVRLRQHGESIADPTVVTFTSDTVSRTDTLRWNADGEAEVVLPVGRYTYQVADSPPGEFMVEPYSAELPPAVARISSRSASFQPAPVRRSLGEFLILFVAIVAGFAVEWGVRRRLGLP